MSGTKGSPTLLEALLPVAALICFLTLNVIYYGDDSTGGPNQLALLFAGGIAALVTYKRGKGWVESLKAITHSIGLALPSILILLMIGALAGTWLISGIVPAMIYYGLDILNPNVFLFAACLISVIVSLATGSSWTTIATVGVALLGIGKVLGLSEGVVAGAIISGAYFGDKMSPLSDTTNLAPAMAGTDLFTHVRYMIITALPAILITFLIFLGIGFSGSGDYSATQVEELQASILATFNINPFLFIVPLMVVVLIIKKVAPVPALLSGSLLGGIFAVIFQPEIIKEVSGYSTFGFEAAYMAILNAMGSAIKVSSDHPIASELFSTGGMFGMMNTIWLIICAMAFGGAMEAGGLLERITNEIVKLAYSTGALIASTVGTCIFFNITASDQYLAIVVPGRMFADTYKKRGLAPENLSRTLEGAGTVTSVLVPWNTCGATQSMVLGVATLTYLPFCFFNLLCPLVVLIVGYTGFKIRKLKS